MFLLRGHIPNRPMVPLGIVEPDKLSQNAPQLIKRDIILKMQPIILENSEPTLNPRIIRRRLIAGTELPNPQVSEKLPGGLPRHLDAMIRKSGGKLGRVPNPQETLVT